MVNISGVTPFLGLTDQLYKTPSFGLDKKLEIDDPYADKVSLSGGQQEQDMTYQHLAKNNNSSMSESADMSRQSQEKTDQLKEPDRLATMMQQVLDAKLGIDRKKLEEIEEKIEALANKEGELTEAEQAQLEVLQKQKEQLIKEGAKKLTEEES
ncbi:MAG: hypothetical protein KKF22_02650 [Gammaproteobacteria bacterium]|nr:hypothetical protein [Gammaproteobacteria bacterium]